MSILVTPKKKLNILISAACSSASCTFLNVSRSTYPLSPSFPTLFIFFHTSCPRLLSNLLTHASSPLVTLSVALDCWPYVLKSFTFFILTPCNLCNRPLGSYSQSEWACVVYGGQIIPGTQSRLQKKIGKCWNWLFSLHLVFFIQNEINRLSPNRPLDIHDEHSFLVLVNE